MFSRRPPHEIMSLDTGEPRERLYEVLHGDDLSLREQQRRVLDIGRRYLDVANGHLHRLPSGADTGEIVASVGPDPVLVPEGTTTQRASTYCRRTVESNSPVALSNAPEQGWADDPAYEEHGLNCYLGATVYVRGEVYGSVCFAADDPRSASFDEDEKLFVELVARLLGRALESAEFERALKERESARERSDRKYEALVDLAPNAILVADAETGEIVEANRRAEELTGYPELALREMTVLDLHPEEQRDRYLGLFVGEVEQMTRERFDDGTPLLVRRADGTDVPVEMSVSAVELDGDRYLQAVLQDISDRREREAELRVKSRALEEASIGISIADATDPDLPMTYVNGAFERITGYDRDTAVGRNCRFLQGPETESGSLDPVREAIAEERSATTEVLNYRADGTPFWNELTVAPVTGEDGEEVTHYVGFQRDVTARKRRDRLVAVLDRVLRHNIRNDLHVVEGYAGLIAERTDGEPEEMAGRIADSAEDLMALSETARELERAVRKPGRPECRNVAAELRAVVANCRDSHPEVTFEVDAPETCRAVVPGRVRRVLAELIENAAVHAGSPVSCSVEAGDERVTVRVSDTGEGLSETERRVLQAGRETQLEHGGGLGLWLVNWLVTSVGGEAETEVEDGTTVTVRLPATGETVDERPVERLRRSAISTHSD
jgi:PAS domain S-box-containing protein